MNPGFNGGVLMAEWLGEGEGLGLGGKMWRIGVKNVKDWGCGEKCDGLGLPGKCGGLGL